MGAICFKTSTDSGPMPESVMIPLSSGRSSTLTKPARPYLLESATSQVSSARSFIALITSAPSANWVVRPRSEVNPSVPTKAIRALNRRIEASAGTPVADLDLDADPDQDARLRADVGLLAAHPLIGGRATVGGFRYDVDTGRLEQVC